MFDKLDYIKFRNLGSSMFEDDDVRVRSGTKQYNF